MVRALRALWPAVAGEGHPMQTVGQVRRHQVTEIPAIAPEVIEYQFARGSYVRAAGNSAGRI